MYHPMRQAVFGHLLILAEVIHHIVVNAVLQLTGDTAASQLGLFQW